MGNIIQSIPEAKLLMASLRSVGYTEERKEANRSFASGIDGMMFPICIPLLSRIFYYLTTLIRIRHNLHDIFYPAIQRSANLRKNLRGNMPVPPHLSDGCWADTRLFI